jgi:ribosomal protein S18 acetylase RimI-like enzyme
MSVLDRFFNSLPRKLTSAVIEARRAHLAQLRPTKAQNLQGLRDRGESLEGFRFRDATASDIPALAQLHVTAWNATYPGTRQPPTVATREWQWRKAFTEQNDGSWFCIVIERPDGALVGFAKGVRLSEPRGQGDLNKIYLLLEYYRLGLGRRLVGHVVRRFIAQGLTSMRLLGEPDNPSRAFHEAIGGRNIIDAKGQPEPGNFIWDDLSKLASICPV